MKSILIFVSIWLLPYSYTLGAMNQNVLVECGAMMQGALPGNLDERALNQDICIEPSTPTIEKELACSRVRDLEAQWNTTWDLCAQSVTQASNCRNMGGNWVLLGEVPWDGTCEMDCPGNTTAILYGLCACNNNQSITLSPNEDSGVCERGNNDLEDCGREPLPIQVELYSEWQSCVARNLEIQLEQQRGLNRIRAQELANEAAIGERDRLIAEAQEAANRACAQAEGQIQSSNCTTLNVNVDIPNFDNGASVEACRSMKATAERAVESTASEIRRCSQIISEARSICSSGSTESISGSAMGPSVSDNPNGLDGDVTVPGVSGNAPSRTEDVSGFSSFNDLASNASENLATQGSENNQAMSQLQREADQCIAAFEQDPDNSTGNNFAGLAQTAAQAFGSLDGSGGSDSSGEMGSGSFKNGGAATPGFQGASRGGVNSPNTANGIEGFNGGGGDANQSLSGGRNPTGPRPRGNPSGNNPGGFPGGMGMPFGGGIGAQGARPGGGQAANASKSKARRSFASAEDRNLVLGYKKVKKGEGTLTYHPDDVKKHGREKMLKLAEETRKNLGEETPLLFRNGKFVRDYLEMKNRLAWQKHNLMQKNRLSGIFNSNKEQEAKAFHQCALFGECYTESRYNIFKLHHFKAIKHIPRETD